MGAVPFDTLKMARKLEASGVDRSIARAIVDAMVEAKSAMAADPVRTTTRNAGRPAEPVGNAICVPSAGGGPSDHAARIRRAFTFQLGGVFVLWVWVTLLGFSYLLLYR
jgi:hypothetical protein